jgi:hypothetical protein
MTPTDYAPIVPLPIDIPETTSGTSVGQETGDEVAVANAAPPARCRNCDSMTVFNGTHPDWDRRFQRTCAESQRDNARTLKQNLFAALPKAMFVFLPLIGVSRILRPLLGWSLPVYTVLALRRVFENGWPATLFKAFALSVAYFLLGALTSFVATVYAALGLHV